MGVANADEANEMAAALHEEQVGSVEEQSELAQTRADLESSFESDGGTDDSELPEATTEDTETEDTEEVDGFAMSVDRRAGTTHIDIEYADDNGNSREQRFAFGKASGRASAQLIAPVEEMEDDDAPITALGEYVWPTLANWCIEADAPGVEISPQDPDFWADNQGLGDSMQVIQSVALGGNLPTS